MEDEKMRSRANLTRYVLYTDDWFGESGYLDKDGYVTEKLENAMFICSKELAMYEHESLDNPSAWHTKEVIINLRVV